MSKALFIRNLLLYFRHRKTVMMSLFSVFMMLLVYILFLGSQHVATIQHTLEQYNITASESDISWLVNCWVLGGLLSIVPFTAARAVLGQQVNDIEKRIMRDFKSSPLRMDKYPIALVLSSTVVGVMMACAVMLVICTYIVVSSKHMFSVAVIFRTIGIVGLHSFMCACIMSYPVSRMKTVQDYSTMCTVVDMLIGFVNCVYVPIGVLPTAVQNVLRCFPFNQATELLRDTICDAPMQAVFKGVSQEGLLYYENYEGVATKFGSVDVSRWVIVAYMLACSLIFFFLYTKSFHKKQQQI